MLIAELLAWINAGLAFLLSGFALRYVCKAQPAARWLKIITALIGVYWCILYLFVALAPANTIDSVRFGQIFVRPAFTVTLAVMAGGAIYRWRADD